MSSWLATYCGILWKEKKIWEHKRDIFVFVRNNSYKIFNAVSCERSKEPITHLICYDEIEIKSLPSHGLYS